jgi:hypothetical protein
VTGLDVLNVLGPYAKQLGLVFTSNGILYQESPAGDGALVPVMNLPLPPPVNANMQDSLAYNRAYLAFSNLILPLSLPMVIDGPTGQAATISQNPVASQWAPGIYYFVGDIVRTSQNPKRWFRCITAGFASSSEPPWPIYDGYFLPGGGSNPCVIQDQFGRSGWIEYSPFIGAFLPPPEDPAQLISIFGQGPLGNIPSGQDVYVRVSYFNAKGESLWSDPIIYENSVTNDVLLLAYQSQGQLPGPTVPLSLNAPLYGGPRMPSWLASVLGLNDSQIYWPAANCLNVYVAAVSHGSAAPTTYSRFFSGAATNQPVVISNLGSGSFTPPTVPTAAFTDQFFVGETGLRQAFILRLDGNDSQSPEDPAAVFAVPFQGPLQVQLSTLFRASNGAVIADVLDATQVYVGQQLTASGMSNAGAAVPSLDETVTVTAVGITIFPAGYIEYTSATMSGAVANAGLYSAAAGPAPIAVVPPGGMYDALDIVALSVAGAQPAGPFTFIPEADPPQPFSTPAVVTFSVAQSATLALNDISGVTAGDYFTLVGDTWVPGDPVFGPFLVASVNVIGKTIVADLSGGGAPVAGPYILNVLEQLPTATLGQQFANPPNVTSIMRSSDGMHFIAKVDNVTNIFPGMRLNIVNCGATFDGVSPVASVVQSSVDNSGTVSFLNSSTGAAQGTPGQLFGAIGIILNFDDNFLSYSEDVTSQLTSEGVPPVVDVFFSKTLNRMVYTPGNSSTHLFSNIGDAANIQNPDGILSVSDNDGALTICFREMINGELLSLKESGGHAITPSELVPSQWQVSQRWYGKAPVGPRAADVGPDFLITFAHQIGPCRYQNGECLPVGFEKQGTWDRVNWDVEELIWVVVDDDNKRVLMGVPLDGATNISHIEVVDYFRGWNEPLFLTLTGDMRPDPHGRRWSEWKIPCPIAKIAKRTLATPVDPRINKKQVLFGTNPVTNAFFSDWALTRTFVPNTQPAPTLPLYSGFYIAVALVGLGGTEIAWSEIGAADAGIVPVIASDGVTVLGWIVPEVTLALPEPALGWNVYFGVSPFLMLNQFTFVPYSGSPNTEFTLLYTGTPGQFTPNDQGTIVQMEVPDVYHDDGVVAGVITPMGIDSIYRPAYTQNPVLAVLRTQQVLLRARGKGDLYFQQVTDDPNQDGKLRSTPLLESPDVKLSLPVFGPDNELVTTEFSNDAVPDAWFELQALVLYTEIKQDAREVTSATTVTTNP